LDANQQPYSSAQANSAIDPAVASAFGLSHECTAFVRNLQATLLLRQWQEKIHSKLQQQLRCRYVCSCSLQSCASSLKTSLTDSHAMPV